MDVETFPQGAWSENKKLGLMVSRREKWQSTLIKNESELGFIVYQITEKGGFKYCVQNEI